MINQSSFINCHAVCNEDNISSFRISRDGITLHHRDLSYTRLYARFHLPHSTFTTLYTLVSRSISPSIPPLRVVETRLCFHRWRVLNKSLYVLIIQETSIKCLSFSTSRKHSNSCVQQRKLLLCQLIKHSSLKSNGNCIQLLLNELNNDCLFHFIILSVKIVDEF